MDILHIEILFKSALSITLFQLSFSCFVPCNHFSVSYIATLCFYIDEMLCVPAGKVMKLVVVSCIVLTLCM